MPWGAIRGVTLRSARVALLGVVVVWAAATLGFIVTNVLPGDPVSVMLGPHAQISEEAKELLREQLGLTQPLWQQYFSYLAGLPQGDMGDSLQLRMPVVDAIGRQLGATLELTGLALAFSVVIALVTSVFGRGRRTRSLVTTLELVVLSAPVFWLGLLFLSVFAFTLGWFPVSGSRGLPALVLPALTLALPCAALLGHLLRDGMDAADEQPFALSVRARGATPRRLVTHHTLRHGSLSALTMAGYLVGSLLGGAVLVESVFARPGIGRVALAAIVNRDLPVISGIIIMSALVFSVTAMLTDIAMQGIDPRMRIPRRHS